MYIHTFTMGMLAPSLHRETTDSMIYLAIYPHNLLVTFMIHDWSVGCAQDMDHVITHICVQPGGESVPYHNGDLGTHTLALSHSHSENNFFSLKYCRIHEHC